MRLFFKTTLLTIAAFVGGCSTAPKKPEALQPGDYSYTRDYISWFAAKQMKKFNVTGLSIALVDDQKVVWAQGFGYADKAAKVPATAETLYRVGSISKLFTSTAAMQLVEQGKLDIDQPLQTYLPEFSIKRHFTDDSPITPRTLMTHHSGLPRDELKGMWTPHPQSFTTVVKMLSEDYAAYPPDTIFSYSNVGMSLMGCVVQRVSGRDFSDYMAEAVLRPAGMKQAYFAPGMEGGQASKGYRRGKEQKIYPLRDVPAGGLNASVADMAQFMRVVFAGGGNVLKPETLAEMLTPQNKDVPLDLNFHVGLGWMLSGLGNVDIRGAGTVAHHSGGTLLFHSQMVLLPEQKLGVVVLANSATARAAVDRIANRTLKMALEAKTGIKQPKKTSPPAADGGLTPEVRHAFAGRYTSLMGSMKIEEKGDALRVNAGPLKLNLYPRQDGYLGLHARLLGFIPLPLGELKQYGVARRDIDGRPMIVASDGHIQMAIGEKITLTRPTQRWLDRVGDYEIQNAGDDALLLDKVGLAYKDDVLMLRVHVTLAPKTTQQVQLDPISPDEALITGALAGMGETLSFEQTDGGEVMRYSGYRLRKKSDRAE